MFNFSKNAPVEKAKPSEPIEEPKPTEFPVFSFAYPTSKTVGKQKRPRRKSSKWASKDLGKPNREGSIPATTPEKRSTLSRSRAQLEELEHKLIELYASIPSYYNVILFGEFVVQFLMETVRWRIGEDNGKDYEADPLFWRFAQNYLGTAAGILIGWLADSLVGKLSIYISAQIIYTFISLTVVYIEAEQNQTKLCEIAHRFVIFTYFTFFIAKGTRDMFMAEQAKLILTAKSRKHLRSIVLFRYVSVVIFNLITFLPPDRTVPMVQVGFAAIGNLIYLILICFRAKYVIKHPHQMFAVEKCFAKGCTKLEKHPEFDAEAVVQVKLAQNMVKILLLFLPFICFGSNLFLMSFVIYGQYSVHTRGKSIHPRLSYLIDSMCLLFAFIIVEFLLLRKLKFNIFSNLTCLGISLLFLGLASLAALLVQREFETSGTVSLGTGQLIIYNGWDKTIFLFVPWYSKGNITVLVHGYVSIVDDVTGYEKRKIKIVIAGNENPIDDFVEIRETYGISYVVTEMYGLTRMDGYDPIHTGPPGYNDPNEPSVFVFTLHPKVTGDFILLDFEKREYKKKAINSFLTRYYLHVIPGTYYVNFTSKNSGDKSNTSIRYELYESGIYSFTIHEGAEIKCNQLGVEQEHSILQVLPATILRNFAISFSVVSAYHFTLVNCPTRVSALVYSYILFAENSGIGFLLWKSKKPWYLSIDSTIIMYHTIACFLCALIYCITAFKLKMRI